MAKMLGNRWAALGAFFFLQFAAPLAFAQMDSDKPAEKDAASTEGQLLVKFADSLTEAEIDEINARLGTAVINRMSGGRLLLVEVAYPSTRGQVLDAYTATQGVIYAEPNQAVSVPPMPESDGEGAPEGEDPPSSPTIGLPQVGD